MKQASRPPRIQSSDQSFNQQQGYTGQSIAKLSSNPLSSGTILESISLKPGSNQINHKLEKKLTGWIVVRKRASAEIYDDQDSNRTPNSTLNLNSSADVVVDLFVF